MSKKIHTEAVDQLFEQCWFEDKRRMLYFFEDVCTINELLSLSQRLEVAAGDAQQKKTYLEISEKTGASTATISRVNRSLIYGNDGYELVFERLGQKEERKNEIRF